MIPSLTFAARLSAAATAAGACALVTACGSTAAPGAAAPTRTVTVQASASGSTPATAPSATPSSAVQSGPAGCQASGLKAQLGASQGTAGTIYQVIVLTNTSTAPCTLYGYPGVSFVTAVGGGQIGKPASKNPVTAEGLVRLAPRGKANVLLAVHDAGAIPDCRITTAKWLRIYPPGDFGSIYVQYKTTACANRLKSIMSVSPVRAGAGSASY